MTRRKETPIKPMHSKKTGAIILIVFVALIAGGGVFFVMAWNEAETIKHNEQQWRLMSCEDMQKDLKENFEAWKVTALNDKGC